MERDTKGLFLFGVTLLCSRSGGHTHTHSPTLCSQRVYRSVVPPTVKERGRFCVARRHRLSLWNRRRLAWFPLQRKHIPESN